MNHTIKTDLSSNDDILKTLDHIYSNYDLIAKDSNENSGIEFYDQSTNGLIVLEKPIHPEIPNYSELAFYLKVVGQDNAIEKIHKITQKAIEKNSPKALWMNEEIQMGLSPAFALAFYNKNYIKNFIDVLQTFDLNHEVYDPFFIEILLDKWKICDETLQLLAARSCSISGQWGIENYKIAPLDTTQKNKFIVYLLEDSLLVKFADAELLLDAMEFLDIKVDPTAFESLFKYYKPLFTKETIPTIKHME